MSILSFRAFVLATAAIRWLCTIQSYWPPALAREAHCALPLVLVCIE
jgi:hypothetical protein